MSGIDYQRNMRAMSDLDLIGIAKSTEEDGYVAEAIAAANAELALRNLTESDMQEAEQSFQANEKSQQDEDAKGLSNAVWLLFAIFSVFTWIPALLLIFTGNRQQAKDAFSAIFAGMLFTMLIVFAFLVMDTIF